MEHSGEVPAPLLGSTIELTLFMGHGLASPECMNRLCLYHMACGDLGEGNMPHSPQLLPPAASWGTDPTPHQFFHPEESPWTSLGLHSRANPVETGVGELSLMAWNEHSWYLFPYRWCGKGS